MGNGVESSMIIWGTRTQKYHQISISPWGGSSAYILISAIKPW